MKLYIIFAIVIILGLNIPAFAESPEITVPDVNILPESTFQLPINVTDLTGQEVYSYYFKLKFDPNVIEVDSLISYEIDETFINNGSVTVNDNFEDQVIVLWYGTQPLIGSGTLVYLNFCVTGNGGDSTDVYFEQFLFNNGAPSSSYATPLAIIEVIDNPYDLNGDNCVDIFDLQIACGSYGEYEISFIEKIIQNFGTTE